MHYTSGLSPDEMLFKDGMNITRIHGHGGGGLNTDSDFKLFHGIVKQIGYDGALLKEDKQVRSFFDKFQIRQVGSNIKDDNLYKPTAIIN